LLTILHTIYIVIANNLKEIRYLIAGSSNKTVSVIDILTIILEN
jgi:hypothetical protein